MTSRTNSGSRNGVSAMVHTLQSMNNLSIKKRSKEQFQNTFSDEFYKDYPDANTTEIETAFKNNIAWGKGNQLGGTPTDILKRDNLPDAIQGFKDREDKILKAKQLPPPPPPPPALDAVQEQIAQQQKKQKEREAKKAAELAAQQAAQAPVAVAQVAVAPVAPVLPVGKKAPAVAPVPPVGKKAPVLPVGKLPPAPSTSPPPQEEETDKVFKPVNFQKLTQHQNLKPKVVEKKITEQVTESDLITALKRQQNRLLKMGTGAKLRYNYAWGKTQNIKNLI